MELLTQLLSSIQKDADIKRLAVGVHWTVVSSRGSGMASSVIPSGLHGEDPVRDAGQLENKSAFELAQFIYSENTLEAGIGLAALNSLIEPPDQRLLKINAFKYLIEKGKRKHVAIFGHFPYLDELRNTVSKLTVFELSPAADEHDLSEAPVLLPDADIVGITSNSLINHTLDGILSHIKKDAFIALVGPSTPLSSVLFDHGISMLSGVRIVDEDALYRSVSQAATFRQTKGTELVTWLGQ